MSAALVPSLFASCYILTGAIIWIIDQILYAIGFVIPPINDPLHALGGWLASPGVLTVITWLVMVLVMVIWAVLLNLLTMMWVERKTYSRLQDRYGIMISIWSLPLWPFNRRKDRPTHKGWGYLQNVADGMKLLQKENLVPASADSMMFNVAPAWIAGTTLMLFAALPWSSGLSVANLDLGILFILAAFSLAPLGILIAGWSANNKYTLVGGLRSAAMLMSYEIPMVLVIIALVFTTGSLDPQVLVAQQEKALVI